MSDFKKILKEIIDGKGSCHDIDCGECPLRVSENEFSSCAVFHTVKEKKGLFTVHHLDEATLEAAERKLIEIEIDEMLEDNNGH
jgi:aerobic-type carbon monoxide dehydrogenase small subunit (CoxS/CutS family)